jgi:RNA polymerase sigma factor (sigma-70 family)
MTRDPVKDLFIAAAESNPGVFVEYPRFAARVKSCGVPFARIVPEDFYLAVAIENGSQTGWGVFYARYKNYVLNGVRRIVSDPEVADEITQDFLAKVPERIRKYNGSVSFRGWLAMVVPNYARNYIARHHKPSVALDADASDNEEIHAAMEGLLSDEGEQARRLRQRIDKTKCGELFKSILPDALDSLDSRWKLLLKLKYFDALSSRVIARTVFKTKENTVAKWLPRAYHQLEKRLLKVAWEKWHKTKEDLLECIALLGGRM